MTAAEQLMNEHAICQLVVVEGGKPIGILSSCDVHAARMSEKRDEIEALRTLDIVRRNPAHDVPRFA
jgi:predicted transcriptional regulator